MIGRWWPTSRTARAGQPAVDVEDLRLQIKLLKARLADQGRASETRAHKTLLAYEDMLAACRQQHGGNIRSDAVLDRAGGVR